MQISAQDLLEQLEKEDAALAQALKENIVHSLDAAYIATSANRPECSDAPPRIDLSGISLICDRDTRQHG